MAHQRIYQPATYSANPSSLTTTPTHPSALASFSTAAQTDYSSNHQTAWLSTNLPTPRYIQSRLTNVDDFQVSYGITSLAPETIIVDQHYFVEWDTPPGNTTEDTANIEFYTGWSWCNQPFCVNYTRRCRSLDNLWMIFLPGSQTNHQPYIACIDYTYLYLPVAAAPLP